MAQLYFRFLDATCKSNFINNACEIKINFLSEVRHSFSGLIKRVKVVTFKSFQEWYWPAQFPESTMIK